MARADARATRAQSHRILARSQALVDPLPYPRYRVEEHVPDQAAFIIGFADTPLQYESHLACRAVQLKRAHVSANLVVIDQDTETVIRQGAVCM